MLEALKRWRDDRAMAGITVHTDRRKADRFYTGGRWQDPYGWLNNAAEAWGEDLAQDLRNLPGAARLNILPQSFFLGSQVADFAAEFRAGISEVVRWTLYDIRPYTTAGFTQRTYFSENIGTATGGYGDTNLQVSGAMAGNESHVCQYLRIMPLPAQADFDNSVTASVQAVAFGQWHEVLGRTCWLEWKIADKTYMLGGPLFLFPAGMGPGSVIANASSALAITRNISYINNGDPSNRALYLIDPPLAILPNRSFVVNLNWQAAQSVTTAGKLGVFLDGYRVRAVQ